MLDVEQTERWLVRIVRREDGMRDVEDRNSSLRHAFGSSFVRVAVKDGGDVEA